jgi:hypothetical protein
MGDQIPPGNRLMSFGEGHNLKRPSQINLEVTVWTESEPHGRDLHRPLTKLKWTISET